MQVRHCPATVSEISSRVRSPRETLSRGGVLSRNLTILLFILFFYQTASANSPCDALLTPQEQNTAISQEFHKIIDSSSRLKRVYLRIQAALWKNRILKKCSQAGGCTRAQIAQAVKDSIVKSFPKNSNALGYGFLVGGIIANAAALAGITVWANPQVEFFPSFVGFSLGQVTFIAAGLLSPFSEPFSYKIRRFSFALKGRNQKGEPEMHPGRLEEKADKIHATYTLREQLAIDRIFVFRNTLRLNFQTAAVASQNADHKGVIAEIADAAMAGYQYFRDIDPREPAIVNSIYASFLIKAKNPSELKAAVMTLIQERSADFDAKAEDYYQHALDAWLVDPPSSNEGNSPMTY